LALAGTLVNPYGLGLWRFLLKTAAVARPEIVEWQPLATFSEYTVFVAALVALGAWAMVRSGRPRHPLLLTLYAVSLILTTLAVRHILFFGITWGALHAEHIQYAGAWMLRPLRPGPRARRTLLALAVLVVLAIWSAALAVPLDIEIPEKTYPARAIAMIGEHLPEGRLVIYFDWGEYALWHLGPEVQVSMDGRRETVYSERVYRQSLDLTFGVGEWDALLEQGSPDLVLVSAEHAADNLMRLAPGWRLVYEDPLCSLFAREGSALATTLTEALPPAIPYDGYAWRFPE